MDNMLRNTVVHYALFLGTRLQNDVSHQLNVDARPLVGRDTRTGARSPPSTDICASAASAPLPHHPHVHARSGINPTLASAASTPLRHHSRVHAHQRHQPGPHTIGMRHVNAHQPGFPIITRACAQRPSTQARCAHLPPLCQTTPHNVHCTLQLSIA